MWGSDNGQAPLRKALSRVAPSGSFPRIDLKAPRVTTATPLAERPCCVQGC